jgi:hypothetical protein
MPFQFRKEAIEEDLNTNFPSQGQGNPPLYYSLSEVVVPTYSINQSAEGSSLPQNLQTAWDFSTGNATVQNTTTVLVNTPGFYKVDLTCVIDGGTSAQAFGIVILSDGLTQKNVFGFRAPTTTASTSLASTQETFVTFLRSGDTLSAQSNDANSIIDVFYRQIADVNGNLVNPLGFSAA